MFKKSVMVVIGLICLFLIISFLACSGKEVQETNIKKPDWYIPEDYGDQYYRETIRIIEEMWDNEKNHLADMTTRIAQTIISGGTVIWDANASHFSLLDTDPSLPCLPKGGMQSSMKFEGNKENIDKLKKGDILITNFIWEATDNAKKRGVHVIGVTNSYFKSKKFSEADNLERKPSYNDLVLEDISDEIFDSHVTSQIGLVKIPYLTAHKVGPGVGTFMGVLYWLTVSEVANKLVKGSDASPLEYAPKYIDILFERLDNIYEVQHEVIWSAAARVAEKIGNGSALYLESEPEGVKWSGTGMSMGLMMTNHNRGGTEEWKEDEGNRVWKQGDVVILADVTNDPDSRMVQEAKIAKEKGCFLIAMGPSTQNELKTLADVYFDNLSPEGYGLFEIEGHDNKIAMVGSVINNVINNVFTIQMVFEMNRRGFYPQYWRSGRWVMSNEYNKWARWVVDKVGY